MERTIQTQPTGSDLHDLVDAALRTMLSDEPDVPMAKTLLQRALGILDPAPHATTPEAAASLRAAAAALDDADLSRTRAELVTARGKLARPDHHAPMPPIR